MKNTPTRPNLRSRERGAIAVVVAFAWTALFGMAVLAVDFGYLYAKRRGVQTVADQALRAAMPTWVNGYPNGFSTARDKARSVANRNGYTNGTGNTTVDATQDVVNNLFTVTVSRTYPTFLGGVFGLNGKTVSARATGRRNPSASTAAIHALNPAACPGGAVWGLGFQAQGGATLIVNGNIESNTQVYLDSATGTVTGTVKSPCTPLGATFNPASATIAGGETAAGAPYADPINVPDPATFNVNCTPPMTVDNNVWGAEMTWSFDPVNNCDTIPDRVYCSSGDINVNPVTSMKICAGTRATFIARGRVIIGANDEINLRSATGAPSNIIIAAYNNLGGAACGGGAVDMGSAGTYNLQGVVYAPNGCIWTAGAGAVGGFTMTGSMVGRNIALGMSPGPAWTFNSPGFSGGGAWTLYQ
jgi:hypothetical protein